MELTPRPRCATPPKGHDPPRRTVDRRHARLNTELLTAILNNNINDVTKSLDEGASVDACCRKSGTTALQLAVVVGSLPIAQLLICHHADVRRRDLEGRQAVHLAAAVGQPALLNLLLDADPTLVNSLVVANPNGDETPLDCLDSWDHDHDLVVKKIPALPKKATPLHIAAQRLNYTCLEALLKRNGRVDLKDSRGLTPLDVLGEEAKPPPTPPLLDLTPDALPIPNDNNSVHDRMGMVPRDPSKHEMRARDIRISPPPIVTVRTVLPLPSRGSVAQKAAGELISMGAKMSQGQDQQGVPLTTTSLHTAVERQDVQLISYLVSQGACMQTWNKDGLSVLHLAVSKQLLDSLRVLLKNNKSDQVLNSRDSKGRTPLRLAVAEEWIPGVSLLLEAGADVTVPCNYGDTVLHIAARSTKVQLLEELLDIPDSRKIIESRNKVHETPLFSAANAGQLPCVNILIKNGAIFTVSLPGDITLLHVAAKRGDSALLADLLHYPLPPDFLNIRSTEGGTASIHLAAVGGHVECVRLLVDSGCDLYATTSTYPYFGSTALHLAGAHGHVKVVEFIVQKDQTSLCRANMDKWYPLHVAAKFAREDCVKCMLMHGADLAATVPGERGYKKTALDIIASSIVHPDIFLGAVFDDCLEVNEYPLNSANCLITIRYDILQPRCTDRRQLKVLDAMLNCGKNSVKDNLLLHPLVETFLHLKWKKLRLFFILMMFLYAIFTVSLTTKSMIVYASSIDTGLASVVNEGCSVTLCFSLTLIILQELMQAARMKRYYLWDLESWVKWSSFLLALLVVYGDSPWMVHVAAIAVLLAWLELLFLLSRWPSSIGFYILMFYAVAEKVLVVLGTFSFALLGFTFAFMIQFEATKPFNTWWEAMAKVFVMSLEFDYGDLFENLSGPNANPIVGRALFLLFMVLIAVVLMNLLIGLAVSDIAALEQQGRAQQLAKQIDFLSMLEAFVYSKILLACCPKKLSEAVIWYGSAERELRVQPGRPYAATRHLLPQKLRQSVISNVTNTLYSKDTSSSSVEQNNKQSTDKSSPVLSSANIEKPPETGQTTEAQVTTMLEAIMKELVSIRKELDRHKSQITTFMDSSATRIQRT